MPGLFTPASFDGFGIDTLHLGARSHFHSVHARRPSGLRSAIRLECPKRPGVYGMVDARGDLVYVGKAKCLRSRLLSYFRPRSRDPKAGGIVAQARLIAWEVLPTELSALLRELELIRRWKPRYNVQGQPWRRRPLWVCLGRKPAPYVFTSPRVPSSALVAHGPLPGGHLARLAVRKLNDWFRLRDCPQAQEMVFADQNELFPVVRQAGCIRHEIGSCLGPCAAACTRAEYQEGVKGARAFLEGRDLSPLVHIEREMQAAAEQMQFERAAALRDRLTALHWLAEQLQRLRQARELTFVYPLSAHDGREWWYLLRHGAVRAVVPAASATVELLDGVFRGRRGVEQAEGILLALAWFRKRPGERARAIEVDTARARCAKE